jgi:O-antigen/teichoic acid export membrane protein
MNSESRLAKNTIIYAIGNFGTKILSYVMVLVYSYFINPNDMGYYDIVLTTISMIQPLIIFQINDGVFRFLIDSNKEKKESIIGDSLKFLCFTAIITEIIFCIFCGFYNIKYSMWIGLLLISTMFFTLLQDIIRGLGKNKKYALYGILNSAIMLVAEIIGLVVLKLGVEALIISKVLAYIACIILMFLTNPELSVSLRNKFNYKEFKPVLKYSAPLVPNTICWWVVNSSDRYIILFFLGAAYNGIYSMSNKFPTILTTITSIFYLAWQESAIKEYNSLNRDKFYSEIFRKYYVLLFTLCLCAIPATRFVIEIFVAESYKNAWQFTGFLYLGAAFSALSSFLGMGYQISKETHRSIVTTIFSAALNIIINVSCIKFIGLHAASVSTFIAYLFLMTIRIQHSKRYFNLNVNWGEFIVLFVSVMIFMVLTFLVPTPWFCLGLGFIAVGVLYLLNKSLFLPMFERVVGKLQNKKWGI